LKCEFIIWELEEQVSYFNSCPSLNFELGIKVGGGGGVRANIKLIKYDAQKPILLLIIQQQLLILF
jgi:hypothetical protein